MAEGENSSSVPKPARQRRPGRRLLLVGGALLALALGAWFVTRSDPAELGIAANADFASDDAMDRHAALGSPPVRAEWDIETDPGDLEPIFAKFAARGIRVLPLAGFPDRFPTDDATRRFCGGVAQRFGPGGSARLPVTAAIRSIEFGNETSYSYGSADLYRQPERYARLFRVCALAARAANPRVGVLAQGDDHAADGVDWVARMYGAVPDLNDLVAGWTSHPYGPESRADPILEGVSAETAARGSEAPIHVTEWGIATDDGRPLSGNYEWPTDMTYDDARDALIDTIDRWSEKFSRVREVYYFQTKDRAAPGATAEREDYFGLTTDAGGPKEPLTEAVKSMIRDGS